MTPVRTCVACRAARPRGELLRVARRPDGSVAVGLTEPGRGAHVCRDRACIGDAIRRGGLARGLRARLSPSDLARLEAELTEELA